MGTFCGSVKMTSISNKGRTSGREENQANLQKFHQNNHFIESNHIKKNLHTRTFNCLPQKQ